MLFRSDLWFDAPLVFASARLLNSGCGPKENDEFREWRGRDPDGDGARGIAKPVGGVAAIAARRIPRFISQLTSYARCRAR